MQQLQLFRSGWNALQPVAQVRDRLAGFDLQTWNPYDNV